MSNPALAETLQTIADKGANAFYEGQIADSIVSAVSNRFKSYTYTYTLFTGSRYGILREDQEVIPVVLRRIW